MRKKFGKRYNEIADQVIEEIGKIVYDIENDEVYIENEFEIQDEILDRLEEAEK